MRAAYEAQLSQIHASDMIAQSLVSLLNIGAYRLGGAPDAPQTPGAQPDLEQARDAIDAAMALLAILERSLPQEVAPLRSALSQLQMAYARAAQGDGGEAPAGADAGAPKAPQTAPGEAPQPPSGGEGPGPAQSSGRLWVPGS